MPRPRRVSDEQIAAALREHRGIVAHAALDLGLSDDYLRTRIAASPELQRALHAFRTSMADKALAKLDEHLERGEPWAIRYVLARFGHYRGVGSPPVRLPAGADPADVLSRLDGLERALAGEMIPLRDAVALLELRRQAVADTQRAGDLGPLVDALLTEVTRAIETVVHDPDLRAAIARELEAGVRRALGGAPGS